MALIPSIFGGRRSNVFDPFSLDVWDPFEGFPFSSSLANVPSARETSAFANTRIDWKETPEAHVFKADLPGIKKEEVKVEIEEGGVLQISGERSKEQEEKNDKWHRIERSSGKFMRRFRLPENAKVEEVKANMENGVLTVTVPKMEVKKPEIKAIDISGACSAQFYAICPSSPLALWRFSLKWGRTLQPRSVSTESSLSFDYPFMIKGKSQLTSMGLATSNF
ncbi:18.2 kDa class I heat shock protein, partial [Cucurbita argyrosperma subsp. sororia]